MAAVDVPAALATGAGAGFPGTLARTNYRAGLHTEPIVFVAPT